MNETEEAEAEEMDEAENATEEQKIEEAEGVGTKRMRRNQKRLIRRRESGGQGGRVKKRF